MNILILIIGIATIISGVLLRIISLYSVASNSEDEYQSSKRYNLNSDVTLESIKQKYNQEYSSRFKLSNILTIVGILVLIISQSFTIISTGYTGVKSTFGQINESNMSSGIHLKVPFVQSISTVNNKQQDISLFSEEDSRVWGESSDKVQVYMSNITVTYQINPDKSSWICSHVSNYKDNLIQDSLVASAIKDASSSLKSSEVTIRGKIEPSARDHLQDSINQKYGEDTVQILQVIINDMNFEDSYNEAITAKNNAEMIQQKQAIENQTAIEKAEADKKVALTNADAKAEVKIKEAEAEKQANELKEKTITDKILIQQYLEKWDGNLPLVTGSDGNVMLDIDKLINSSAE